MTAASTPLGQPTTAAQPKPAAATPPAPAGSLGGSSLNGAPANPQNGIANAMNQGGSMGSGAPKYTMADQVRMIDSARKSGNNMQAYKLFNTFSDPANASQVGALDSALRQAWGTDAGKSFVNELDSHVRSQGYDINNMGNDVAGWDPSRWDRDAGKNWTNEWVAGMGGQEGGMANRDAWGKAWAQGLGIGGGVNDASGHAMFGGGTGVGVQADGKTPYGQQMTGVGQAPPPGAPPQAPPPSQGGGPPPSGYTPPGALPPPSGYTPPGGPPGNRGAPPPQPQSPPPAGDPNMMNPMDPNQNMLRGGNGQAWGQGGLASGSAVGAAGSQNNYGQLQEMPTRAGAGTQGGGQMPPTGQRGAPLPQYRGDVSGMAGAMGGMGPGGGGGGYEGGGGGWSGSIPGMAGGPGYQYDIANAGGIQKDIQGSPYYNEASQRAYMEQANRTLDPQWKQTEADNESKLVNMGLSRGSEAWDREMSNLSRNKNDAYQNARNASILNAGAEGTRMQGMDLNQGNFHNQAQNQQWSQNMGEAGLRNNAQNMRDSNSLGQYSAWSNNQLGNRAQDTNAFSAYNQASLGNRGMTMNEQNQNFNIANQMRMNTYLEQDAAMRGMYPNGPPGYAQYSTPGGGGGGGGDGGSSTQQGIQNQYAGYSAMGGGLLNGGMGAYNAYTRSQVPYAPNPTYGGGGPRGDY